MKQFFPRVGARCLALALAGSMIAGCGSDEVKVAGGSDAPPPKTERAKKAADFERDLKSKSRRD